MSDTLVINEIYLSLQGESTFAGLAVHLCPAHRLQLALLVLRHRLRLHRRQKNAAGGNPDGSPRLAAPFPNSQLVNSSTRQLPLVELTGGEPLLQKNSLPLMKSLCDDGFTVLLETSGAHDISPVDPRVHRIMDLKCPSSGEAERNRWENLKHLKATDEIKFVIGTREDYEWAKQTNRRAQTRRHLSLALFVGASAVAGAAGQVAEKSSGRTDADFAARVGGKNHRRRVAGAVSSPDAQGHLAAGTTRRLEIYDLRFTIYDCPQISNGCVNRKSQNRKFVTKHKRFSNCSATSSRAMSSFIEPDGSWPIVWERARDVHVWDADGKKYLDLTAAFGVAAAGHANPRVVKAGQRQLARLPHAMGDVHPHARKAELARELSRITFERWTNSGRTSRAPEISKLDPRKNHLLQFRL